MEDCQIAFAICTDGIFYSKAYISKKYNSVGFMQVRSKKLPVSGNVPQAIDNTLTDKDKSMKLINNITAERIADQDLAKDYFLAGLEGKILRRSLRKMSEEKKTERK